MNSVSAVRVTLTRALRLALRGHLREIGSVPQRVRPPRGCSGLLGPPSRPYRAPRQTGTCGRLRCHRRGDGLVRRRSRVRPFHRGANPRSCSINSSHFPQRETMLVLSLNGEKSKQLTVNSTPFIMVSAAVCTIYNGIFWFYRKENSLQMI